MLLCPLCNQEVSDTQISGGRCPHCGGIVHWNNDSADAKQADEQVTHTLAAGKSNNLSRSVYATINPRDLSPDMKRSMDQLWEGAKESGLSPRMTIKNQSATIWGSLDLVIPSRRVRNKEEAEKAVRADYEIGRVVGEGGMGTVFAARQASINRTVAIKMLRAEIDEDLSNREKFLAEAVVTGELEHPNIVPIYDVGSNTRGQLFYSMKLVHGTPWNEVLESKSLPENLSILMRVCDAVGFAHEKGVIHRDLKPENVMLGGFGEVLVMDWGIAISTALLKQDENIRKSIGMGGTPAYMAPEMASGPLESIDRRSDIYLLGAILFEIITGYAPHTGSTVTQCLMAAARNELVHTDRKGELIEIAYKALATHRADRYATVNEFQQAIRDYQSHSESIALASRAEQDLDEAKQSDDYQTFARTLFGYQEAIALWPENETAQKGLHSANRAYAETAHKKGDFDLGLSLLDADDRSTASLYKALQDGQRDRENRQQRLRNVRRMVTGLVMVIFLVVSGFLVVVSRQQSELKIQNNKLTSATTTLAKQKSALEQRERELTKTTSQLVSQQKTLVSNQQQLKEQYDELEKERNLAQRMTVEARESEANAVRSEQIARYRSYLAQIGLAAAKTEENAFADATRILDAYSDSPFKHWEWGRLRRFHRLSTNLVDNGPPIDSVAFSPDGERAAVGQRNGIVKVHSLNEAVPAVQIDTGGQYVFDIAFSPNGQYIATAGDATGSYLALWDSRTGEKIPNQFQYDPHSDWCLSVAFSATGDLLLSTSYDKTAKIWSMPKGRLLRTLARHHGPVWDGAFSPNSQTIVTGSHDGTAIVWRDPTAQWNQTTGNARILPKFSTHEGPIHSVAFSPDGKWVATAGHDKIVRLWKPADVEPFSFERALNGNRTDSLRDAPKQTVTELTAHTAAVRTLAFSPDGNLLLSGSSDNTIIAWDVQRQQVLNRMRGHSDTVATVAFQPNSGNYEILSGSFDGSAKYWTVAGYQEQTVLLARLLQGHDDAVLAASFDNTGQRIVTASRDRTARIWNLRRENTQPADPLVLAEGHEYLVSTSLFTPDGRYMITAAMDNTARIWDTRTGVEVGVLQGIGRRGVADLDQSGTLLLAAGDDNRGRVYDLAAILAGKEMSAEGVIISSEPRKATVVAAAFVDPDGNTLAMGDEFGRCTLYRRMNDDSYTETWSVDAHSDAITSMKYIASENTLATSSRDGTIRIRELTTGNERSELRLNHPAGVRAFVVASDSAQILSTCADGRLRLWNAADGTLLHEFAPLTGGAKTLAANVRRLLSSRSWSEEQLANRANLTPAAIRSVLSGKYDPADPTVDATVVEKLAAALAVSGAELRILTPSIVDIATGGKVALSASTVEGQLQFWDLEDKTAIGANHENIKLNNASLRGAIASARFTPNGESVVISGGRRAAIWELASGQQGMVFSPHGAVSLAAFSPNGKFVVTGSWDGTAKVWNAESGLAVVRLTGGHSKPINSTAFSPDGSIIITASDDGAVRFWDWQAGKLIPDRVLRHSAGIREAVFSPDGNYIATASDDAKVGIWRADSGEQVHLLEGHRSAVLCAAFSADSQYLATGSRDKAAHVWHVGSGREIGVARGHTGDINRVAFSPDGRRLVTASSDQTAKLWDSQPPEGSFAGVVSMQEVLSLDGHSDAVTSATFSPSGDSILTAGREGSVILWEAEHIAPAIYLAESDLILTSETKSVVIAPQALFTAPMRNGFSGSTLTANLLARSSTPGRIVIENSNGDENRLVVEGDQVNVHRPGMETVSLATIIPNTESDQLQLTFHAQATHSMIEQLLRQLTFEVADINAAPQTTIVEIGFTFPDNVSPLKVQRTIRPQAAVAADVATR